MEHVSTLTDTDRRSACIEGISGTMQRIREKEDFDDEEPFGLELYYTYLNVSIPFDEFEEIMKGLPRNRLGRVPPHFRPFRISARGVEAKTDATDPAVIARIRDTLSSQANPEAARNFLHGVPGLAAGTLTPAHKTDYLQGATLDLADALGKEGHIRAPFADVFNTTNVLGGIEAIVGQENPLTFETFCLLSQGSRVLQNFMNETSEHLKEEKLKKDERALMERHVQRAKELRQRSAVLMARDAAHVIDGMSEEEFQRVDEVLEVMMEVGLIKDKSPQEAALQSSVAQAAYMACLKRLPLLRPQVIQKLLETLAATLQRACVGGSKKAAETLWQSMEMRCLLASAADADDIQRERPEVLLERARQLYQEQIPLQIDHLLKNEDVARELQQEIRDRLRQCSIDEARQTIRTIRNAVTGGRTFLQKQGKSPELQERFAAFAGSIQKKLDEVEKFYQHPPAYVGHYYAPDNTNHAVASCNYHAGTGRTLAKMAEIPNLGEKEIAYLASLRERLSQYADMLESASAIMSLSETAWQSKIDGQQGRQGFEQRMSRLSMLLTSQLEERYPAFADYRTQRAAMDQAYGTARNQKKDEIHRAYTQELQRSHGTFEGQVFFGRVNAAVRELDQEYSGTFKELRRQFEQAHPEIVKGIQPYERFIAAVEGVGEALRAPEKYGAKQTNEALTQLSHITYRDLEEGEFDLVPSKTRGDAVKGWISCDCSASAEYAEQILNMNFVNYRVYQGSNGHRQWVGNIYVLDARYGAEPEIIFDAIQVSRSTTVQPRMFMQQVVEGFAKMGLAADYTHIVSNVITSTREGWLVSNRPQLREAYIALFGGQPVLPHGEEMKISDDTAIDTFQSLEMGGGKFRVLWQHPDTEATVSLDDVQALIADHVNMEIATSLLEKAKTDELTFTRLFRSRRGFGALQEMKAQPDRLRLFLTLINRFFGQRSSLLVIRNPEALDILGEFEAVYPAVVPSALSILGYATDSRRAELRALISPLREKPDLQPFIMELLQRHIVLPAPSVERASAIHQQFKRIGLGEEVFRRLGTQTLADLEPLTQLLESGQVQPAQSRAVGDILHVLPQLRAIDLTVLWPTIAQLENARAIGGVSDGLRTSDILNALITNVLSSPEEAAVLVRSAQADDKERVAAHLRWLARALQHKLVPALPATELLAVLWDAHNLQSRGAKESMLSNTLTTEDVFSALCRAPTILPLYRELLQNIQQGARWQDRAVYCTSILREKSSLRAAVACSRASDEKLDDSYFYIFQLGEALPADIADDQSALPAAFQEVAFNQKGLQSIGDMQQLVRCGVDYLFTNEAHAASLRGYFSVSNLQKMPRSQQGETERIREKKLYEDIPEGYGGIVELLKDQKSIYTHPFHQ